MAGKTVSAHADAELIGRIEHTARIEARPVSQIVGAAALDHVAGTVARDLVGVAFDLAERRVVEAIPEDAVTGLETEDDTLAAAVGLTSPAAGTPNEAERMRSRGRSGRTRAAGG